MDSHHQVFARLHTQPSPTHSFHPATYPFILPFTPTTSVIHSHIFPLTYLSDTCFLIHPSVHPVTHPSKPSVPALSPLGWITGSEVDSPYPLCSYLSSFHSCTQDVISESIMPSHPWPRAKASLGCDLNASSLNSPVPRLAFCALDTVALCRASVLPSCQRVFAHAAPLFRRPYLLSFSSPLLIITQTMA